MSTASTSTPAATRAPAVTRKQLLSLFGLAPLGVYVFFHLWTNMYSFYGPKAFDEALDRSRRAPGFLFLEIFGLGMPLLIHTVYGIIELRRARPNNLTYSTFDNLKYGLQRLSAVGLLLFIPAHILKARILPSMNSAEFPTGHETWQGMHDAFFGEAVPLTLVVYVLGLLGICYHLANGLYTAGLRWGVAVSPSGRGRLQWISASAFLLLLAMSCVAIGGFYQAS